MSELVTAIRVNSCYSYLFQIALDHAPEPGEHDRIEEQIQTAMERLGVPAEQVTIIAVKSAISPSAAEPLKKETTSSRGRYLLFVNVKTEEGGFTEEPAEVAERAARAYARYARTDQENIAAVVLENAHLEVKSWESHPVVIPLKTLLMAGGAAAGSSSNRRR